MCKIFKVSRSGFYSWLKDVSSKMVQDNLKLLSEIKTFYYWSKKTYGSLKDIMGTSSAQYYGIAAKGARLMKKENIRSIIKKKFKVTTDSEHKYATMENKLERNFKPGIIGTAWVSDITYIKTSQGWLYLTSIIDLGDRKVIGWAVSSGMKAIETVIPALKIAQKNRLIVRELLFHSDRDVQYACNEFKYLLDKNTLLTRSISRKGNCCDNAVAESFFKTLKAECVYQNKLETKQQAALLIFKYIEVLYNHKRLHSARICVTAGL